MPNDLRADLQAALGSGFRVNRELQGGSMSRVFVAEDLLLQREVVVKLLPPELMAGRSIERFRAEMQHAARLQNPHVVPVLSAGAIEYDGNQQVPYYIMPFIGGETLRVRLEREGTLPPAEAARILMDVVDAVAHAHERAVLHRDLKPDNIFLIGKNALVADFGVSEALLPEGSAPAAGVTQMLGTPGYMSPEQAAGHPHIDQRADFYSIGVLAYEMLGGRRPIAGASIQDLLVAQAVEAPVPLDELEPEVPPALAAIVMRCLEKRPEDRFQNAAELHRALEGLGIVHGSGQPLIVHRAPRHRRWTWLAAAGVAGVLLAVAAVESWHHLTDRDPNTAGHLASVALLAPEYFQPDSPVNPSVAELVDRISTSLSRIEGLKVVNYMSVGTLYRRGGSPTLTQLGQALGVEHVLVFTPIGDAKGSRVSIQLVEAPTQAQIWVDQYSPDSTNLESVYAEVVSRVSHALLGPAARLPIQAHSARARREGAHAEYLAGLLALRRRTPDGVWQAIRHFEEAVRLDSTHVEALGRLATALGLQLSYGYRTTTAGYPTAARALELAERATALDPTHGEPVGFLAYIEYLTLAPLQKVRADFDRAIRLRASEADVAGWNALLLLREGKIDQSLAESRRALDLDPLSSARHLTLALAALGGRRYDLAGLEARRASETEPDLRRPRQVEGLALLMQNRGNECAALDLWPHLGVKAMCLRAVGRDRAAQILVDSLRQLAQSEGDANAVYADVLPAQELATYYAWTGNPSESLQYLKLAFDRSPVGIDLRIVQSGVYDRVRNAPGFLEELQRLLDQVWPRVLEQKKRLQDTGGMTTSGGRSPWAVL